MEWNEFLANCTEYGNPAERLMDGIKKVFPEYWEAMPDRRYEFWELLAALKELGVVLPE